MKTIQIKDYIVPIVGLSLILIVVFNIDKPKEEETLYTKEQESCIMNHANEFAEKISSCKTFQKLEKCKEYYLKLICNIYDNNN